METNTPVSDSFDENQSLQVMREMIQVAQNKLFNDGILLIVWGYAMSLVNLMKYLKEVLFLPNRVNDLLKFVDPVLPLLALCFTIYYIFVQKKKVTTYIGASLRYVWIALFGSMVLTNLILFNVLHEANFTLQHPVFMVLTAFAVVVTGVILRNKLIILGGFIFGILAYISSFLVLNDQMLLAGIAWFIALVIPGHIMYFKRNR